MAGDVRRMIAEAAAGAGDGADALRRQGIPVVLEGFTVEVLVDTADAAPAASVRVTFGPGDSRIVRKASPGGP
jgi:hypothetical protein